MVKSLLLTQWLNNFLRLFLFRWALLGFKKELVHLDGEPLEIARRGKVSQNGDKLRLK